MHNTWTDAENFLLVEKLVAKSEEEAWREVAEKCDGSGTFESEGFKCKAVRKYAAYHNVPVESVDVDTVANSPQGLEGWAEMNIVVPGIEESKPATPCQGKTPDPAEPEAPVPKGKAKAKAKAKSKSKPAKAAKREPTAMQGLENKSKEILTHLQWSSQVMEKMAGSGDAIPSEWRWAKSFMEDYNLTMNRFKESLKPDDGGDDLTSFVDELKLHVIGKTGIKALKKTYGDRYETMLTLFTDRCYTTAAQYLDLFNNGFFGNRTTQTHRRDGPHKPEYYFLETTPETFVFGKFVGPTKREIF
jgi:hypothetical protein